MADDTLILTTQQQLRNLELSSDEADFLIGCMLSRSLKTMLRLKYETAADTTTESLLRRLQAVRSEPINEWFDNEEKAAA